MNISFVIRVMFIAVAFAIPFLEPENWRGVFGMQLGYFIFVGIVFSGSLAFSLFGGCMRVIFSQSGDLPRPSLYGPLLFGRSPLQFFWFSGLLSISVGVGSILKHLTQGLSFEGVLLIAVGLGLVSGSVLTLKKMVSRFVSHKK